LPEFPDRIARAKLHFDAAGLPEVEFFEGLYAQEAGLLTSHLYEVDNPGTNFRMGPKPVGIWLGHWALWSHLVHAYAPDERVMILEDDALFQPDWKEKFEDALEHDVPADYDILYPGHCCCVSAANIHISGTVFKTTGAQCNHCYVIRVGMLPLALRTLRKVWAPIDIQMTFELLAKIKAYAIIPRIVDQFDTEFPD
jgi:hypothetical protein